MNAVRLAAPSSQFLAELRERAKRYGWLGDYVEVARFVRELHIEAGIPVSDADLEPYEDAAGEG